ncbi:hypothetical protein KA057_00900 [Candidatus Gracilibacteria bacterium]|nr:hypothetical protein [Candidatus Gracilibacteria bacterium]
MNKNTFVEVMGWYGTLAIMLAYFANSFGFIGAQSIVYQALNATGAFGIVLVSYMKRAYQPMILNIMWFVIGIVALSSLIF